MPDVTFADEIIKNDEFSRPYSGFLIKETPKTFHADFREVLEQVIKQRKEIEEIFTKLKHIEDCDIMSAFERKDREIMDELIQSGKISEDEFI